MDLDTSTQVCPACSDPAGLCSGGKGSLSQPCLGSEAPLGWLGALGTGRLVKVGSWADQQQEAGMRLKLSVRLGKGGTVKPSLKSPLAGSRAWRMKTGISRAASEGRKGIKSPLRPSYSG